MFLFHKKVVFNLHMKYINAQLCSWHRNSSHYRAAQNKAWTAPSLLSWKLPLWLWGAGRSLGPRLLRAEAAAKLVSAGCGGD